MSEATSFQPPEQYVVLENGRRTSTNVHANRRLAEEERAAYVKLLTESGAVPERAQCVKVARLLFD